MKNLRNNKGAITLFVLLSCLFFLVIVTSTNVYLKNKSIAQEKQYQSVKEKYSKREYDYDLVPDSTVSDTTFSTEWGTIDIVWLDLDNNVIDEPLDPLNYLDYTVGSTTYSMTAVVYNTTSNEFEPASSEDKGIWYNYSSENTGNALTNGYQWANAKTANGSYFVWIPRYAYRITYYAGSITNDDGTVTPTGDPTGYYDGYGQWNASTLDLRHKLDDGIETVKVEKDGKKYLYIVHPAFMKDVDKTDSNGNELEDYARGGWSEDIAGFWCAKYEASGSSTAIKFEPGVTSLRSMNIGDQYKAAITAQYGYSDLTSNNDGVTSYMNSHQMKNSEWGAVAYLAHSKYGLNGKEIAINNSSSYYTGNSGGSATASSASGITNEYNKENGVKASTTQNVYGIYDLSGGAFEYVSIYNKYDSDSYINSYGWDTIGNITGIKNTLSSGETTIASTKYATRYENNIGSVSSYGNQVIYTVGKVGDATKEVNQGGINGITITNYANNWNIDYPNLLRAHDPFGSRGGNYNSGYFAGLFCSNNDSGHGFSYYSFRAVLVSSAL